MKTYPETLIDVCLSVCTQSQVAENENAGLTGMNSQHIIPFRYLIVHYDSIWLIVQYSPDIFSMKKFYCGYVNVFTLKFCEALMEKWESLEINEGKSSCRYMFTIKDYSSTKSNIPTYQIEFWVDWSLNYLVETVRCHTNTTSERKCNNRSRKATHLFT